MTYTTHSTVTFILVYRYPVIPNFVKNVYIFSSASTRKGAQRTFLDKQSTKDQAFNRNTIDTFMPMDLYTNNILEH